jgi:hypothetical protein
MATPNRNYELKNIKIIYSIYFHLAQYIYKYWGKKLFFFISDTHFAAPWTLPPREFCTSHPPLPPTSQLLREDLSTGRCQLITLSDREQSGIVSCESDYLIWPTHRWRHSRQRSRYQLPRFYLYQWRSWGASGEAGIILATENAVIYKKPYSNETESGIF